MPGNTNFPGSLDTDGSLYDVTDGVSYPQAVHHNNLKEAVKALEAKLGINNTAVATSLDWRLGHPSGHLHDGASGNGPRINPTTIPAPSGAVGSPTWLHDHLMATAIHQAGAFQASGVYAPSSAYQASGVFAPSSAYQASGVFQPSAGFRQLRAWDYQGSLASGASLGAPFAIPRTLQIDSVSARLNRAPSGATTALDINFGPTSLWAASQGNRIIFPPGTIGYDSASPNLVTYPSGALVTVDVDSVGSNDPGQHLSITFFFRE